MYAYAFIIQIIYTFAYINSLTQIQINLHLLC
nr:MAG TPA: hypothetical protein [Crassvirales sp.]